MKILYFVHAPSKKTLLVVGSKNNINRISKAPITARKQKLKLGKKHHSRQSQRLNYN
jgi:hypothetical protein